MDHLNSCPVLSDWSFVKHIAKNAKFLGFRALGRITQHNRLTSSQLGQDWYSTEIKGIHSQGTVITSNNTLYRLNGPADPARHTDPDRHLASLMEPFCGSTWPLEAETLFKKLSKFFCSKECVNPPPPSPKQPSQQKVVVVVVEKQKHPTTPTTAGKENSRTTKPKPIKHVPRRNGHVVCVHNRRKSMCPDCGGGSICEHGKQRHWCSLCGGTARCKHGKQKSRCADCGGSGICEHGRLQWRCALCRK
jgi:hypothetical protein